MPARQSVVPVDLPSATDVAMAKGHEPFPARVAAIDVGSNALRLLVADLLRSDHYITLEQVRTPVRLGHDTFLTGRLTQDAIDAAVDALRGYAARLDALQVRQYRAVATAAVRGSENGDELVHRARTEAGIELEPITGAEEIRLVHLAVRQRIDLGNRPWVLTDLGGGSVEVSLVDRDAVRWSVSHRMGAVRLLEELAVTGDEPGRFRRRIEEYAARLKIPRPRQRRGGFIATGGNIEALAKLAGASVGEQGVALLPIADLAALIDRLVALSPRRRVEELGLREDRADVILPAALVYERLCRSAGFATIHVPNVGVKDGIILDLADDFAGAEPHRARQDQIAFDGALALGRRFRFDAPHARHVASLALMLFDQLPTLHLLGAQDRRLLMVAALLHDVGAYVGHKGHHKHSLYLIQNSELPGLSPDDILIVANVARYHRKSAPAESHTEYMRLSERQRERVVRLAALLRVADALDREHLQAVTRLHAEISGDAVDLHLCAAGDLELEHWAVEKKAGLFEQTFDRRVRLREAASG